MLVQHGTRGRAYYTLGVIGPDRTPEAVVLDAAVGASLTNAYVRSLTGMDRYQAGQLLKRLVEQGRLEQHGERRGTVYVLPR